MSARWRPMTRLATPPPVNRASVQAILDAHPNEADEAAAQWMIERVKRAEHWTNLVYYCMAIRADPDEAPDELRLTWLSIKRHDRGTIRDWRDLQRIKNDVVGPECEAVELFPAESRLVDSANQYHLWALPPGERWPLGFGSRFVTDHVTPAMNIGQRRLRDDEK